jgi:hypothetical protein
MPISMHAGAQRLVLIAARAQSGTTVLILML